jgi:hypothetical protein
VYTSVRNSLNIENAEPLRNYVGAIPYVFPGPFKKGDVGVNVKLMQELLYLKGYSLKLDGDFGPVTEQALVAFSVQELGKNYRSVILTKNIWRLLVSDFAYALTKEIPCASVYDTVVLYANKHLTAKAREVGGENMGPWVRLYMGGNEGVSYPWCAGFLSFILRQVAQTNNTKGVFNTFSCDEIGRWAISYGKLIRDIPQGFKIHKGSLFLIPSKNNPNDWIHTGIVVNAVGDVVETIEGNTNDQNSREGVAVCRRFRRLGGLDLICNYAGV